VATGDSSVVSPASYCTISPVSAPHRRPLHFSPVRDSFNSTPTPTWLSFFAYLSAGALVSKCSIHTLKKHLTPHLFSYFDTSSSDSENFSKIMAYKALHCTRCENILRILSA